MAFADSSIVVLALPDLYGRLHTTIEGVAWVVTAYNVAVAVTALLLVPVVSRLHGPGLFGAGIVVFATASVTCSFADSIGFLVTARAMQGVGGALLLAGALPVLGSLAGSSARGAATWTLAGTFGAALGPALGGVLTQAWDWRAIFLVQAPVAALGLVAVPAARTAEPDVRGGPVSRTMPANVCLGLLFGALVGVLFLAVLLVITVWGYSPIAGAAVLSVLPAATLAVRPVERRLPRPEAVWGGAALLALGLVALALLPASSVPLMACALALCGAGLGLAVPILTHAALDAAAGLTRSGTLTIGIRHAGLVLALALIAPLLASSLPKAGDRATLEATAVLLDAPIGLQKKVPIALDVAADFDRAQDGEIPDLSKPFDDRGAQSDSHLAAARDDLVAAIEETLTRAFRPAFLLSAALAALALGTALVLRRRIFA
jgi:predicted MFS family arabinose efflux permease